MRGLAEEFFDHGGLDEAGECGGEKEKRGSEGQEPEDAADGRAEINHVSDKGEAAAEQQPADAGALQVDRAGGEGERRFGPVEAAAAKAAKLTRREVCVAVDR